MSSLDMPIPSPLPVWIDETLKNPECVSWPGVHTKSGYARFGKYRVTRLIMRAKPGQVVMHTCDNPGCINPLHLRLGTQAENVKDRDTKGRGVVLRGTEQGGSKLTNADVLQIRATYKGRGKGPSQAKLAKQFNVSERLIWSVITNRNWRHV